MGNATMSTERGNDRLITEYKTETCSLSKVHWHVCIGCNSGKRGRETNGKSLNYNITDKVG